MSHPSVEYLRNKRRFLITEVVHRAAKDFVTNHVSTWSYQCYTKVLLNTIDTRTQQNF